jgi:hypothetical protein
LTTIRSNSSYTFVGREDSGGGFWEQGAGGVRHPWQRVMGPGGPWTLAQAWGGLSVAEDGDNSAGREPCGAGRRGDDDDRVGCGLSRVGRQRLGMGTTAPGGVRVGDGRG